MAPAATPIAPRIATTRCGPPSIAPPARGVATHRDAVPKSSLLPEINPGFVDGLDPRSLRNGVRLRHKKPSAIEVFQPYGRQKGPPSGDPRNSDGLATYRFVLVDDKMRSL
jgi:hypothetical protein